MGKTIENFYSAGIVPVSIQWLNKFTRVGASSFNVFSKILREFQKSPVSYWKRLFQKFLSLFLKNYVCYQLIFGLKDLNIEPGHINMHFEDNWTRITKNVTKNFFLVWREFP